MRHLKLASTLCIGLLTIGRKGGTFVRKSRHKKGNEKSHSDNTELQAKRGFKEIIWMIDAKIQQLTFLNDITHGVKDHLNLKPKLKPFQHCSSF